MSLNNHTPYSERLKEEHDRLEELREKIYLTASVADILHLVSIEKLDKEIDDIAKRAMKAYTEEQASNWLFN